MQQHAPGDGQSDDEAGGAEARRKAEALRARIAGKPPGAKVQVDAGTLRAILALVEAPGRAEPPGDGISPDEAAELLGMSCPSAVRLIERGYLHPREALSGKLSRAEVLAYQDEQDRVQREALANLTALTEEHDF